MLTVTSITVHYPSQLDRSILNLLQRKAVRVTMANLARVWSSFPRHHSKTPAINLIARDFDDAVVYICVRVEGFGLRSVDTKAGARAVKQAINNLLERRSERFFEYDCKVRISSGSTACIAEA